MEFAISLSVIATPTHSRSATLTLLRPLTPGGRSMVGGAWGEHGGTVYCVSMLLVIVLSL